MPKLFSFGGLNIFIWTSEGRPLEPIHVHVSQGDMHPGSPKFWLSKDGYFVAAGSYKGYRKMYSALEKFIERGGVNILKSNWVRTFDLSSEEEIKYYK